MRQRWKQMPRPDGGRGVTAARRAFNSHGGGSNPSGLIDRQARSSMVRAGS